MIFIQPLQSQPINGDGGNVTKQRNNFVCVIWYDDNIDIILHLKGR